MITVDSSVFVPNAPMWLKEHFTHYNSVDNKTYKVFYEVKGGTHFPYGARYLLEDFKDNTVCPPLSIKLTDIIKLSEAQDSTVNEMLLEPSGVLFSAPGTGKTVMGCRIVSALNTKTLVLVPTAYLLNQWVERMEQFLNVTPSRLGDGFKEIGDITIAIFNSALTRIDDLKNKFGLVMIDETHRIAAQTYQQVVGSLNSRYKIGLTGTLERKDGLEFIVLDYLGHRVVKNIHNQTLKPGIIIKKTSIVVPQKPYVEAITSLSENANYNALIAHTINEIREMGRLQLALSLRTKQLDLLHDLINPSIVIKGSTSKADRDSASKNILNHKVILASTVLDEGADIPPLDTLHLLTPTNNIPKLVQRINRITRFVEGKKLPLVIDYWFKDGGKGWSVQSQQMARMHYYKEKGFQIWIR